MTRTIKASGVAADIKRDRLVEAVRHFAGSSAKELATGLGLSIHATNYNLRRAAHAGLVVMRGGNGSPATWWPTGGSMIDAAAEWEAARLFCFRMLVRFCGHPEVTASRPVRPDRDDLIDAIRLVFPRMGWGMLQTERDPTEWGMYLDVVLLWVHDPAAPTLRAGSLHHKYIAAAAVLGWVEAPWALSPAPWPHVVDTFPLRCREPLPWVSPPDGWPAPGGGSW